jgi:hypothetical protein
MELAAVETPRPLYITNTPPPIEKTRSTTLDLMEVMLDIELAEGFRRS